MKYGKNCVCGRGGECQGVSAAFALLEDARKGYVQLPALTVHPMAPHQHDMNSMRASYLRHLKRSEETIPKDKRQYVALHHFHPIVVQKHAEMSHAAAPIPKTLKKVDLKFLKMTLGDEDRVRDIYGKKTKLYYFVPNYPTSQVKEDLKRLIRAKQIHSELSRKPSGGGSRSSKGGSAGGRGSRDSNSSIVPQPSPKPVEEIDVQSHDSTLTPLPAPDFAAAAKTDKQPTNDIADESLSDDTTEGDENFAEQRNMYASDDRKPQAVNSFDMQNGDMPTMSVSASSPIPEVSEAYTPPREEIGRSTPTSGPPMPDRPASPAPPPSLPTRTASPPPPPEGAINAIPTTPMSKDARYIALKSEAAAKDYDDESVAEVLSMARSESRDLSDYGDEETVMSEFHQPMVSLADFEEDKLPENVTWESEEGRQFLFKRVVKFEQIRAIRFAGEVDEVATYWRGSLEVLQAGIFETARAERLIRGAALANQAYGEAMQAMYDDVFLDEEGNIVSEGWKQNRLRRERITQVYSIEQTHNPAVSPKRDLKKQVDVPGKSILLDAIIDAQSVIADKFNENSERIFEEIVSELTGLRRELKSLLVALKKMGDVFVKDMQATEEEVRAAYTAYEDVGPQPIDFSNPEYETRQKSRSAHSGSRHGLGSLLSRSFHGKGDGKERRGLFGRKSNHGSRHGNEAALRTSNHGSQKGSTHGSTYSEQESAPQFRGHANTVIGQALKSVSHIRDGWFAELFYRAAVNHQAEIWEKCGAELSKIMKKMQILEMNRQIKLHQLLLDFAPRQRRLFLGLAPIPGPILDDLVALRAEPKALRDQVEDTIRRRQEIHLQTDQGHRSMYLNRSRATMPNLEELHAVLTGEFFDNGLLRAAKVVERKVGIRAQWKPTLAVVTADKYLHLFDTSMHPEVQIGNKAEPVFSLLLPDYELPTTESDDVGTREVPLLSKLTPSDSLALAKCCGTIDATDPRVLDITESVVGLLTSNATRKITIRTTGREETQRWFNFMTEGIDEGMEGK